MPFELLQFNAAVNVSPQNAASIGAACPVAATAASSHFATRFLDFADASGLAETAQRSFFGQAEEVFKGVDSR